MVKLAVQKKKSEAGQAVLLVVAAMSVFLLGAVGLAVDGSHLYAQRQAAQAAADAAAQAGIVSIFNGTNAGNLASTSDYWCTTTDSTSPCVYARTDGYGVSAASSNCASTTNTSDCIHVEPNAAVTVSKLSPAFPINLVRVTVTRPVGMTLTKFVGLSKFNVSASATAAIVDVLAPVPIIVTHPTNPGTFAFNGGVTIQICGGPGRSIQVNSTNSATQAISGGSNDVDLSRAGPNDPGNCTTGTGAGFGDAGGPTTATPLFNLSCVNLSLGTCTSPTDVYYLGGTDAIDDPLAGVPVPPKPPAATPVTGVAASASTAISTTYVSSGSVTCPSSTAPGGCDFFTPGDYPSGILAKGGNNYQAYFFPGIYYIDSAGFRDGSNGNMAMYPGANADTSTNGAGSGMLVYNTGTGVFKVGSNGSASLVGSDNTSVYKGILLFQDRSAPAHIQKNTDDHIIGGGGALSLTGTIYINNSLATMIADATHYQLVQLQGGGGSGTLLKGEIIVNELLLGGSGTITMNLNPAAVAPVHQIALVQ
jgi:hypothetical protein